jgi:hypothetical protein
VTRRHGRRRKQLLDDLKETRKYRKFREEVLDHILWEVASEPYDRLRNERDRSISAGTSPAIPDKLLYQTAQGPSFALSFDLISRHYCP